MLTHFESENGAPACGSTNPDPDLTADPGEVTCKQCLDVRFTSKSEPEVETHREGQTSPLGSVARRGRSEFLTYEEVLRICSRDTKR